MKAIVHTKYGGPEVAELKEIAKPIPKNDEVLIRVFASTVNRTDAGFRKAEYFISRFWSGLLKPKQQTLGCEFAGVVESVGNEVIHFKVGDKVFGYDDKYFGGHAEFLTIHEKRAVEIMPKNLTFKEAAPITEGAHYALSNIKSSKIKRGEHALVNGATGAIGSAAVQLLKHFGVTVTAVCNTKNVELVKSLGADVVIDFEKDDFTKTDQKFHVVFDAVGKSSFRKCKPLLLKKGIYISTELGKNSENIFLAILTPFLGGKKVLFPIPFIDKKDLTFFKQLIENGEYKPIIDREYKLEQVVEAYKYVETGQKTGNVILKITE